jgi:hypothetical protein
VQADGKTEGRKWRVAAVAAHWPRGGDAGKLGQSVFSKITRTTSQLRKERKYGSQNL